MFDSLSHKILSKGQILSVSSFWCYKLWLHSQVVFFFFFFLVPQNGCNLGLQTSLFSYSEEEKTGFLVALSSEPRKAFPETSFLFHWPESKSTSPFLRQSQQNGLRLHIINQVQHFKWGQSLRHHCFFSIREKCNVYYRGNHNPQCRICLYQMGTMIHLHIQETCIKYLPSAQNQEILKKSYTWIHFSIRWQKWQTVAHAPSASSSLPFGVSTQ